MAQEKIVLRNGEQSVTFVAEVGEGKGYRPEWFRQGKRAMLRFKDHEFLNIGAVRVISGRVKERSEKAVEFVGEERFAGTPVGWSVRVAVPEDGKGGFTVSTKMIPLDEPVEVLEALTTFETPYDYSGKEHRMTVLAQQPVYRAEGDTELNGAGFMQPIWYYGRKGRAHLTYQSASPLMAHSVREGDGSNWRCIMLLGNWDKCSARDMFSQPTREITDEQADIPFPDASAAIARGKRGTKFLVGAMNWNNSLYKDPNWLVEPKVGISQEVTVDFADAMPDLPRKWDGWLAAGWERLVKIHFPRDGRMGAFEVAKSVGASWLNAAEWLSTGFQDPKGIHELYHPTEGTSVYSHGTRPKSGGYMVGFAGQWGAPLAYLGHVWKDAGITAASDHLDLIFGGDIRHGHAEEIWTIGPTPWHVATLRKHSLTGVSEKSFEQSRNFVTKRTNFLLNPPKESRRGDAGILAFDALANLLAADAFDKTAREAAAKELLEKVNAKLDGDFWTFNCAAEGDLVGAGQSRPFGHGVASSANMLAYKKFGDAKYLQAAERFANLLLAMHCITWNESPAADLDTRGWCHGSTGGRDQLAQLPPWETGFAMQQFAPLMVEGKARAGVYDVLWLFSHSGLAQFPKARILKRLYRPDMSITYRPMHELPTEREFYYRVPYLAYENPWDQTMVAGYQGVEPIILSMFFGGALVGAEDDRVAAFVPEAAAYIKDVDKSFTVDLWNPTCETIETRLFATVARKRNATFTYSGAAAGKVSGENVFTSPIAVPPRQVVKVRFAVA
ncbi:MAG TPA: hypothetical protein VIL86_03535 [Tepidisphaeraceae bacterium]